MENKNNNQTGYTIIETMIAVSLFLIVITISMGALLNANLLHKKSQDMRSIMDNLSFIMEDMSKNLRTGYNYHCSNDLSDLTTPLSCSSGSVISFKSSTGSQWVYVISSDNSIQKSVSGGTSGTFVNLTPEEVAININHSGFSVIGAEAPPGNSQQPFATIRLVGTITYKDVITPFSLQTSVTQRLIDIQ